MYKKIMLIFITLFIFLGCSNKENMYATPADIIKEQALTQSQKVVIKEGNEIKAFVVVTYINKIKHELVSDDKKIDKFIVSIHVPSDGDKSLYNQVIFRVNSIKIKDVTELNNKDKILNILPVYTQWSKYFLVEVPHDYTKRGILFSTTVAKFKTVNVKFQDSYGNLPMNGTAKFKTVSKVKN